MLIKQVHIIGRQLKNIFRAITKKKDRMSGGFNKQDYFAHFDQIIRTITDEYEILNLIAVELPYGEDGY